MTSFKAKFNAVIQDYKEPNPLEPVLSSWKKRLWTAWISTTPRLCSLTSKEHRQSHYWGPVNNTVVQFGANGRSLFDGRLGVVRSYRGCRVRCHATMLYRTCRSKTATKYYSGPNAIACSMLKSKVQALIPLILRCRQVLLFLLPRHAIPKCFSFPIDLSASSSEFVAGMHWPINGDVELLYRYE